MTKYRVTLVSAVLIIVLALVGRQFYGPEVDSDPGYDLYGIRGLEIVRVTWPTEDIAGQKQYHFVTSEGHRTPFFLETRPQRTRQFFLKADPTHGGGGVIPIPTPEPLQVGGRRERALLEFLRRCDDGPYYFRETTVKETIDRWLLERPENADAEVSELFRDVEHRDVSIRAVWQRYESTVRSGYALIPEARQFDDLFDDVDHYIEVYHDPYSIERPPPRFEWRTTAYFANRYELRLIVDIELTSDNEVIQGEVAAVLGCPRFSIGEIDLVRLDGSRVASYSCSPVAPIDLLDWQQLIDVGGSWAALGVSLKLDEPVKNFDSYVSDQRRDYVGVDVRASLLPVRE